MLLTIENQTQPLTEWALDYGIPAALIRKRLRKGWNPERAVTEPMRVTKRRLTDAEVSSKADRPARGKRITYNGETLTITQWAERVGIDYATLKMRLRKGWTVERTLTEPVHDTPGPIPELIEFDGLALTVKQWAARLGIHRATLRNRLKQPEWTLERAFTPGDTRRATRH